MNNYEIASNRWDRFRQVAERAAAEAKAHAESLLAEVDDVDGDAALAAALDSRVLLAAEEFARHRSIMDRCIPEIDRARVRALSVAPLLPGPPRR